MSAGSAGKATSGGLSPAGRARRLAPKIVLLLRAHEFCTAPGEARRAALAAAVQACAGVDIPELYNPLWAACEAARNARPAEWRAIAESIDSEIHVLGAMLRAGGWLARKDIAA